MAATPRSADRTALKIPANYPSSLIYIDESGTKPTVNRHFVVGAVKLRSPGTFTRTLLDVRERNGFERGEFKFSEITRGSLSLYYDMIDQLAQSDATVAACVVDDSVHNPFRGGRPVWLVHAEVTAQLLVGCINRRELVSVLMDGLSTPRGCALDDTVRDMVNRRLRAKSVVTAACLDSRSTDGLQVADLIASAIAYERRCQGHPNSPKAKVAGRLRTALGVANFSDQRSSKLNIATYQNSPAQSRPLKIVKQARVVS